MQDIIKNLKGWSYAMNFNISSSKDEEPEYIDICRILNGGKIHILPERFNGISSKLQLLTELKLCAMKSGFALVHRSSKSQKQLESSNYTFYITLQCQHGRTYKPTEKLQNMYIKQNITLDAMNYANLE